MAWKQLVVAVAHDGHWVVGPTDAAASMSVAAHNEGGRPPRKRTYPPLNGNRPPNNRKQTHGTVDRRVHAKQIGTLRDAGHAQTERGSSFSSSELRNRLWRRRTCHDVANVCVPRAGSTVERRYIVLKSGLQPADGRSTHRRLEARGKSVKAKAHTTVRCQAGSLHTHTHTHRDFRAQSQLAPPTETAGNPIFPLKRPVDYSYASTINLCLISR